MSRPLNHGTRACIAHRMSAPRANLPGAHLATPGGASSHDTERGSRLGRSQAPRATKRLDLAALSPISEMQVETSHKCNFHALA